MSNDAQFCCWLAGFLLLLLAIDFILEHVVKREYPTANRRKSRWPIDPEV